jgi:hypothetical protein
LNSSSIRNLSLLNTHSASHSLSAGQAGNFNVFVDEIKAIGRRKKLIVASYAPQTVKPDAVELG